MTWNLKAEKGKKKVGNVKIHGTENLIKDREGRVKRFEAGKRLGSDGRKLC